MSFTGTLKRLIPNPQKNSEKVEKKQLKLIECMETKEILKKYTVPFDQRFIINQQSDQQMVTCVNGKTTTA